jgi:hypothetical protein
MPHKYDAVSKYFQSNFVEKKCTGPRKRKNLVLKRGRKKQYSCKLAVEGRVTVEVKEVDRS